MHRGFAVALFGTAALWAVSAIAADTPDFSGLWSLDEAKSEFGGAPQKEGMKYRIDQKGAKLKVVVTAQGEDPSERLFNIGGEDVNKSSHGDVHSKSRWEGRVLVFDLNGKYDEYDFKMVERWTLSPDGEVLTITREISSSGGDISQKYVLARSSQPRA